MIVTQPALLPELGKLGGFILAWVHNKMLRGSHPVYGLPLTHLPPIDRVKYENALSATRAALGDESFERAWREGREMTLEDAVEYVLSGQVTPRHD